MNEFEILSRQGYPQDRLLEMAGVGYRCKKCGAYVPEGADEAGAHPCTIEQDEERWHRAPEPVESPVICQQCGRAGHESMECGMYPHPEEEMPF